MVQLAYSLVLALSSLCLVSSHPEGGTEEQVEHEIRERTLQHVEARQALDGCYNSVAAQELRARAVERRASMAAQLREQRGLIDTVIGHPKRDPVALAKWSQVSHNRSALDVSLRTPETTIFGSNATCALVPETIVGPYFVTGELLRSDISEDQPGVRTHLDIQFVDVATCKPVPNMLVDIWHANSTGVYSGVVGSGGLNTTFMRGVQLSDRDGAVQFSTAFPGHYMGRATHIHVVAQTNGTVLPNGTYTGGKAKHIGQLYFDDSLVLAVERHWPYHTNTIPLISSTQDFLTQDEATTQYDPYVDYVQLSHNLADGLMAWITIAVNMSADHSASLQAASHYYEGGGVAVPFNCSNMGGFPPFNGTFPPFNGTFPPFPPFNGSGFPPFNGSGFPPFNGSGFPFPPNGTFPGGPGCMPGPPPPNSTSTAHGGH